MTDRCDMEMESMERGRELRSTSKLPRTYRCGAIIHILYGSMPSSKFRPEWIKLVDTGHAEWASGRRNLHRRGHVCGIFGLLDPGKFDHRNLERIELVLDVRARILGAYSCAQQVRRVSP